MRFFLVLLLSFLPGLPAFSQLVTKVDANTLEVAGAPSRYSLDDVIVQKQNLERQIKMQQDIELALEQKIAKLNEQLEELEAIISDATMAGVKTKTEIAIEAKIAAEQAAEAERLEQERLAEEAAAAAALSGGSTIEP